MSKKPRSIIQPEPAKVPRIQSDPTLHWKRNPSWRISLMQFVDPYGWHVLDEAKARDIQRKLACFERMTWSEILIGGKKQNHLVPITRLCAAARARLAEMGQPDIEKLVSLHLSGRERVWGILDEGILTVLWWDPDHEICPSLLRHT